MTNVFDDQDGQFVQEVQCFLERQFVQDGYDMPESLVTAARMLPPLAVTRS